MVPRARSAAPDAIRARFSYFVVLYFSGASSIHGTRTTLLVSEIL
jgi:hypothetical protein